MRHKVPFLFNNFHNNPFLSDNLAYLSHECTNYAPFTVPLDRQPGTAYQTVRSAEALLRALRCIRGLNISRYTFTCCRWAFMAFSASDGEERNKR